ncbi:T9SS type A sorting domain-containing protein [Niastella caeni]|uniref:T9SS type A sorting domain-containing protein n=1 Tax=Niastella caeni TaxID=2569763 RepID=A0A4S8HUP8_9BACT|nr:T9SS type A sorting domain-containing protein [Niastella caeni]THU39333.1 T9SS type A sorting domain-containing protein [Niastella caeni]
MKKIYSFLMVSAIALTANAQLVINENFSGYSNPLGTQGGWVQNGSGNDVQVNNFNPLTRVGYTSGGNYMSVASLNGTDPHKPFSVNVNTAGGQSIFMSFVVRVSAAPERNAGPQFSISLANSTNSTFPAQLYIAEDNGSSTDIEFGVAVGSSAPNYTSLNLVYGTTYLVVIRYDAVAGGGNDDIYLWVNPSLTAEPTTGTANASQTNSGEVGYADLLNAMKVSQSSDNASPDADYDGFRVSAAATSAIAWSNLTPAGAPLPVQLTSFNANEEGLNTKLVWNTVEESGITSYVVEKSADGRIFTAIGSVKAANLKTYSYTDIQPASEFSYYRLKMVEMDGSYKYSYVISVKSKLTMNISLSPNPVKNILTVQHPKAGVAGHVQIISANGQTLKDIRLSANAVISTIDMSGFTSGLYHIVYRSGSDVFSKTVLKQ